MSFHVIYGLIDPNTKELRYIGYSSNHQMRYYHHYYSENLKAQTHKNNWLKLLLKNNQKAELIILEYYQSAIELPQAEIDMIAYFKFIGCNLTNGTPGGDGRRGKHKAITIKKMIKSQKKRRGRAHFGFENKFN
jgi:hypothetical protein